MRHRHERLTLLLGLALPLAAFAATTTGGAGGSNSQIATALKTIEAQSPQAAKLASDRIARAAIDGMLREIDPSGNSFTYTTSEGKPKSGQAAPAIVVRLVEGVPTLLSVYANTDAFYKEFSPGDLLLKVGDQNVVGKSLPEIESLLEGDAGSSVKLTAYRRASRRFVEAPVKREAVASAAFSRNVGKNIAWLDVNILDSKGAELVKQRLDEIMKMRPIGLVLDLRSTAGGTVDDAVTVAGLFVSGVPVVRIEGHGAAPQERSAAKTTPVTMPMVVICDFGTSGAAEVLAAALQDAKRAVVVGERSGGQACAQTTLALDPQTSLQLTTEIDVSPSGRELWSEGVKPDIAMKAEQPAQDVMAKVRQEFSKFCRGEKPSPKPKETAVAGTAPTTGSTSSAAATTSSSAEVEKAEEEEEEETGPDGKPRLKTSDGILEEYRLVKQYDTMLVRAINILVSANIFFEYGQRQH